MDNKVNDSLNQMRLGEESELAFSGAVKISSIRNVVEGLSEGELWEYNLLYGFGNDIY